MTAMSLDELVNIAKRYHPDASHIDFRLISGEEWDRYWGAAAHELNLLRDSAWGDSWKQWLSIVGKVKDCFPKLWWIDDASRSHMGCCYAVVVNYSEVPRRAVVGCRSLLVPAMFWIYESCQGEELPLERTDIASQLARVLKNEGLEPIPSEWAKVFVPGISVDARLPGATLADALFTWYRW